MKYCCERLEKKHENVISRNSFINGEHIWLLTYTMERMIEIFYCPFCGKKFTKDILQDD